jgi:hypothetical protein
MTTATRRRNAAFFVFFGVSAALLAGCGGGEKAPETSTTSTTTSTSEAPAPSPTEKSISPTGGNLFTPPVTAPGLPTPAPGNKPGNHPN